MSVSVLRTCVPPVRGGLFARSFGRQHNGDPLLVAATQLQTLMLHAFSLGTKKARKATKAETRKASNEQ